MALKFAPLQEETIYRLSEHLLGRQTLFCPYNEVVQNNPNTARLAVFSQLERITTDLGKSLTPSVTAGLFEFAKSLSAVADVIEKHPLATKYALDAAAAISALLVGSEARRCSQRRFPQLGLVSGGQPLRPASQQLARR